MNVSEGAASRDAKYKVFDFAFEVRFTNNYFTKNDFVHTTTVHLSLTPFIFSPYIHIHIPPSPHFTFIQPVPSFGFSPLLCMRTSARGSNDYSS
jgi:hypothetical protein